MKKFRIILLLCLIMLGMTACERPASANKLAREAKKEHGPATVVSKAKTPVGYTVTMHDTLQDFDYTLDSYVGQIGVIPINRQPIIADDFITSLVKSIKDKEKTEIENIENKYNVTFDVYDVGFGLKVHALDPDSAKQAAYEIAEIYQRNNLNNRLDGFNVEARSISQYDSDREGASVEKTVGYYWFPSLTWEGTEGDLLKEFTVYALELDLGAEYVRTESRRFCDTGYDLDKVSGYPNNEYAPVTYFYFKASDGGEFYVADFFLINEDEPYLIHVANNYEDRKYPENK